MAEDPTVQEFEIFKEAMREENLEMQIEITKKLGSLAKHLGEEATRNELLPFIKENIDFHDEILLNLSEQLKQFIPLVGGYEHSRPVLDVLMKLCNTDETIVRDKTVETLKNIGENLSKDLTEELFVPVVEALANKDWFTSKCSAAALYSTIYSKVNDEKKTELRNSFRVLIQDDSPIVRKVAAINLIDLISCMETECIKNEFIAVFDNISKDPMDSVRVFAVDIAIALAKRLTENEIDEFIFKTIENWAGEIQRVVPFAKTRGKILAMYQKLVKDSEAEVRIVIAKNLFGYCKSLQETYINQPKFEDNFEPVFQQSIMPQIHLLITDPNDEVRLALSSNMLALSTVLREECFRRNILPLLVDVLENEASMPIQANMLQNLNCLPTNIDLTLSLQSIKNVVRSLIINSQSHWRTRRSIFVAFMHIAKFSTKEYFAENLKIFYAALLGDPVFAIRRTAPIILPLLAKQYGINWTSENIIPYFTMFTKDCRYLYRFVPLFGINELIDPSLDVRINETGKYLKDLKIFAESTNNEVKKRAIKRLAKLSQLHGRLVKKLAEQKYQDILELNEYIHDFKNDTIELYAGETMNVLQHDNNCDIFSIKEETLLNDDCTYLEGILSLILREFLYIIVTLNDDLIENVQIRAVYTLNRINIFLNKLGEELGQSCVKETIKTLSDEENKNIEKQLEIELNRKVLEVDEEKVDTELMENIITGSEDTLPDLGGNIPELEINGENINKNKEVKPENKIAEANVPDKKIESNKIQDKNDVGLKLEEEKIPMIDDVESTEKNKLESNADNINKASTVESNENSDKNENKNSEPMEMINLDVKRE
ncbi:hypothetical protein NQ314_019155 [Rhamnusium bicolor]|uniref:Phosphatase PP2A regulatory subunit A/Splicing factor 3B subunit 1-like HEAT repeat domain-containing protein n=1 Tax=Rhamnusium bicolor TaxID=1586634 RepID=A0AAV8WP65_9CUCU|nr:hypothetical protein NQ314_019155 [Rhamnusium bicolor]